jgi:hypothetical protein
MRRFYQDKGGTEKKPLACVSTFAGGSVRDELTRTLTRIRYIAHPVSMDVFTFTLDGKERTALVFGDQHTDIAAMENTCDQPSESRAKLQYFIGLITCNSRACVDVHWEYPYFGTFATRPYAEQVDGIYEDIKRDVDLMLLRAGTNFTPCFDPDRSVEACKRLGNARFHAVDYRHVEVFDALLGPLMALCTGSVPNAYGSVAEQMLTRSPLHLAYFLLTLLGVDLTREMESLRLLLELRVLGGQSGRVPFKTQLANAVRGGGHTGYFLVRVGGGARCFTIPKLEAAVAAFALDVPPGCSVFLLDAYGKAVEGKSAADVEETRAQAHAIIARGSCLMTNNMYAETYTQALDVVKRRLRSMTTTTNTGAGRLVDRAQLRLIAGNVFLPTGPGKHVHGRHVPSEKALDHLCRKVERKRRAMTHGAWEGFVHAIASKLLERLDGADIDEAWPDDNTFLRIMFATDAENCMSMIKTLNGLNVGLGALFMDLLSIPRLLTSDAPISITAAGYAHTATLVAALERMGATPVHSSPVEVDPLTNKYKKCVRSIPVAYVPRFVDSMLSVESKCTFTTRVEKKKELGLG